MTAREQQFPAAPRAASERAYLRAGLPALYRDPDSFGMRFVGALEEVLDPLVAMLDNLHWHLDPRLAPPALLDAMAAWLGLRIDEAVAIEDRRELVRHAFDLAPMVADEHGRRTRSKAKGGVIPARGTRAGLELVLDKSFPQLGLSVHDDGATVMSEEPHRRPQRSPRSFTVRWSGTGPDDSQRRAIHRIVADMKPVGVRYSLQGPGEETA